MAPYTVKGVASMDEVQQAAEGEQSATASTKPTHTTIQGGADELYQLVGIVVHSGQANAGHYYSFIKDRW